MELKPESILKHDRSEQTQAPAADDATAEEERYLSESVRAPRKTAREPANGFMWARHRE
jgi:hypothetical protein